MKSTLKLCLLLSLILFSSTFLTFQNARAYPINETVFASGMDLLFIDSFNRYTGAESPYRYMLLDVSPWENHAYVYPNSEDSTTYSGPSLVWGKHGKALDFDGTEDYVNVLDHDSLDLSSVFTVMAWVYPQNLEGERTILGKSNTGGDYNNYILGIADNDSAYISYWNDPNGVVYTTAGLTGFQWTHVAGVWDGTYLNIYVNGELNATSADFSSKPPQTNSQNLTIGSRNQTLFFDGIIDEVRVYPLALTEAEIYNDMITIIAEFKKYVLIASKLVAGAWSKGFVSGKTGVNNNDIDLPWADSSTDTGWTLFIDKYIPSFQSFRSYCTLEQSTNFTNNAYVLWRLSFFRDGEIQTDYYITIRPNNTASSRTWYAQFVSDSPTGSDTWKTATWTYTTDTDEHHAPIVVDIWVGPDNKHVSMRITAENETTTTTPYSWTYSFDLIDRDGNVAPLETFDGWVRLEYKVQVWTATNGRIEIESHRGLWETVTGFFKKVVSALGGAAGEEFGDTVVTIVEPIIKPVTEIFEPVVQQITNTSDPIGSMIQNAIGGLAHELYGAASQIGKTLGDPLYMIFEAINGIGNLVIESLLNYATLLITAFTPFTTLIWSAFGGIGTLIWNAWIGLVDNFWTAFSGLFNSFLDFMDTIFAWTGQDTLFTDFATFLNDYLIPNLADALTDLPGIFDNFFDLLAVTFTRTMDTTTSIVDGAVDFFNMLWTVLETGYGGAMSIADFIAPFLPLAFVFYVIYLAYLFDDQGLEGLLNHVKMLLDIAHFVVNMLITTIQTIINFFDQLVEAIPVVE